MASGVSLIYSWWHAWEVVARLLTHVDHIPLCHAMLCAGSRCFTFSPPTPPLTPLPSNHASRVKPHLSHISSSTTPSPPSLVFTTVHWQFGDQPSLQQTGHYHCHEENQSECVLGHSTGIARTCVCVCVCVCACVRVCVSPCLSSTREQCGLT